MRKIISASAKTGLIRERILYGCYDIEQMAICHNRDVSLYFCIPYTGIIYSHGIF